MRSTRGLRGLGAHFSHGTTRQGAEDLQRNLGAGEFSAAGTATRCLGDLQRTLNSVKRHNIELAHIRDAARVFKVWGSAVLLSLIYQSGQLVTVASH